MKHLTRTEAINSPEVHNLTKEVLILSAGRDLVDRYFDVAQALEILKDEMNEACGLQE
jgi:hypothetical protein